MSAARTSGLAIATAVALTVAGLALAGCDPGVRLGNPCELASDCPAPLGCVLGRCREACREARDCGPGLECLRTSGGVLACSLAQEDECGASDPCDDELTCVAARCRQSCAASTCATGMRCGAGDVCERAPEEDAGSEDGGTIDSGTTIDAGEIDAGPCASPCDLVRQCGCSGSMRCGVTGDVIACMVDVGAGAVGSACSSEGQCQRGTGCHGGRCLRYCSGDADCQTEVDVYCDVQNASGAAPPTGVRLCSEACDITTDTGCPIGSCDLANLGGSIGLASWCRDVGTTPLGGSCAANYECVAHAICEPARDGSGRQCLAYCGTGAPPCAAGTDCVPEHTLRGFPISVCQPPA